MDRVDPIENIKVMLIEDDPNFIKAMVHFLENEQDIEIIAAALNKEEAMETIRNKNLDVVLLDINLTENRLDGLRLAADISEISTAKIIMLTSLEQESIMIDSFASGAVHFIPKSKYAELPNAIRSVYYHFSPIELLTKDYSRLKREEQLKDLSTAEREIFHLAEQGYTQSQMEKELIKSTSTIKNQVHQIIKKLRVSSLKEAVDKVRYKGVSHK